MATSGLSLRGISISGAEAGSEVSYGNLGMPTYAGDMSYYVNEGMNTVRIPIRPEYIFTNASATQVSTTGAGYLNNINKSIVDMLDHNVNVILDLHSYMRYAPGSYAGSGNNIVTNQGMYNTWSTIATKLSAVAQAHPDSLLFEIANEPNSMSSQQVLSLNNAGIAAIRDAGLKNMVVLNGNSWTGLHSWSDVGSATDGKSNAQTMIPSNIVDPLNNYAISVHQYVDWNGSGTSPTGQTLENFKNYLEFDKFMTWVKANDMKVILGEFGGGKEANSMADLNYLLQQVESHPYVQGQGGFIGWTAWVGGHTWAQNNFNYIGPNADGTDSALMTEVYSHFLNGTTVPLPEPTPFPDPTPVPPDVPHDPIPAPPTATQGTTHAVTWNWGARETINHFDPTHDIIDLSALWKSYNDFSLRNDGHGNMVIDLLQADNHLITLTGVTLDQFSATNLKGVTGGNYQATLDGDAKFYSFKWDYGLKTVINDFDKHLGVIDLQTFSGKQFSDLKITTDTNGDTHISLGFNSQEIKLIGIAANELTANHFIGLGGKFADAMAEITPVDPIPTPPPVVVPPVVVPPVVQPTPNPTPAPTPDPSHKAQVVSVTWDWGGRKVINHFDATTDKVDLTSFWTKFDKIQIASDGSGNVLIDLLGLNNQTITLANTSLSSLSAKNFIGVGGTYASAVSEQAVKYYDVGWHYGAKTVIDHFDPDVGVFNLTAFHQNFSAVKIMDNPSTHSAVIDLGFDHQTITLTGVSAHDLSADNFLMG